MKAIKLVFVAALTAVVLMLTSCMGDGNNQYSGGALGMVVYESSISKYIFYGAYHPITSPALTEYCMINGDKSYLVVEYSYDLDDPSNANYAELGYVNANISIAISEAEDMGRGEVYPTTIENTLKNNEIKPAGIVSGPFYEYKLITQIGISNYNKDNRIYYRMEYDLDQTPENTSGSNIYNVHVRVMHESTTTSSSSYDEYVVFNMRSLVTSSKNKESGSKFYIRLNYVSSIDNEEVKWTAYNQLLEVAKE